VACGLARRRPYKELPELFSTVAEILYGDSERKFIHAYTYDLDAAAHSFGSVSPEMYVPPIVAEA
jgi:hypothetical protein